MPHSPHSFNLRTISPALKKLAPANHKAVNQISCTLKIKGEIKLLRLHSSLSARAIGKENEWTLRKSNEAVCQCIHFT
jgi:hypothetical protein